MSFTSKNRERGKSQAIPRHIAINSPRNVTEGVGASYFAPLSHRHFFGRRRTRLASTTESDSSRSRSPLRDQAHDVADESSWNRAHWGTALRVGVEATTADAVVETLRWSVG